VLAVRERRLESSELRQRQPAPAIELQIQRLLTDREIEVFDRLVGCCD
jgi:hypothetical protein